MFWTGEGGRAGISKNVTNFVTNAGSQLTFRCLDLMMLLMKICAFAFFFVSFFCQLSPQVSLEKVVASNPCLKFHSLGGRRRNVHGRCVIASISRR